MRIGIIGAGISGLSVAKLIGNAHEIEILERDSQIGGIAKTKEIQGVAYHMIGGHCFNSKHQEVLDFVFNQVQPLNKWHKIERNANIRLNDYSISYPIEYSVKQIYHFDPSLALRITKDFLNTLENAQARNLEEWFRIKFGDTLAELYFLPYNSKIWNTPLNSMQPDWVKDKLPIPDKLSFFEGLISQAKDKMPHSSFFYPNSNDQQTFIEALALGSKIQKNYNVFSIRKDISNDKWVVNEEKEYDKIISTLPLNILPSLIFNCPAEILIAAQKLKYNQVSTMLWETEGCEETWTYIPGADSIFHRYIHIGNFFKPRKNITITEAVGVKSYTEMHENGKKDPFLKRCLDYNVSDHAYVVYDQNHYRSTQLIKSYLQFVGLETLGRFGEWEYYNMDICIKKSFDLADKIKMSTK